MHPTIEEAIKNQLRLDLGEFGPPLLSLLISVTNDQHTTVAETERLFAAARQPKALWIVPGGGHFNMHAYAGKEYENRILDFLERYLGQRERNHVSAQDAPQRRY